MHDDVPTIVIVLEIVSIVFAIPLSLFVYRKVRGRWF